ncbi:MAG: hypothetical protein K6F41_03520 [Lachnospira sp.]|nr:hypothetical protein [Lachnospira sp.]
MCQICELINEVVIGSIGIAWGISSANLITDSGENIADNQNSVSEASNDEDVTNENIAAKISSWCS